MKWIAILLYLIANLSFAQEKDDLGASLKAARDANLITELQFAEGQATHIKKHYPADYEAHTHAEHRVLLATQLEDKVISPAEYRYKWAERHNAFLAKREADARQSENTQAQITAQQQAKQDGATAVMLQGIGNAVRNAYPVQGTNCRSINYGGTVVTNCN